jgi:hypothetical protein
VGPRAGVDFWRRRKSLASAGIQIPDRPARSLVAKLTMLYRPQCAYILRCNLLIQWKCLVWTFVFPEILINQAALNNVSLASYTQHTAI